MERAALEVVDRLLELGREAVAHADEALERCAVAVEHVRAFWLRELALDGDIGEVHDALLADDGFVRLVNHPLFSERRCCDTRDDDSPNPCPPAPHCLSPRP